MAPSPLLLVYASSLQCADGTTVQLRRLLADFPMPVWHIHGPSKISFPDVPRNCVSLEIPFELRYPFNKGAGFLRRTWRRWGIPPTVKLRLAQATRRLQAPAPRVAYVVVYNETQAITARSILRGAGIDRYVLHIMDLLHVRFDAHEQPNLAALISNAAHVMAVSPRLANEIAPVARLPIEVFPLVAGFVRPAQAAPDMTVPYLIMSGAMYAADPNEVDFLNNSFFPAWLKFAREIPGVRWRYAGAQFQVIAPALRGVIEDIGLLPDPAWCQTLAGARCALLPVVHRPDERFRYSVPSRLVDYVTAGVPVIAPPSPNTATGDFLDSFAGQGVLIVRSEEEVLALLRRLFLDDDFHRSHAMAAQSAVSEFSAPQVRQRLHEHFQRIAMPPSGH